MVNIFINLTIPIYYFNFSLYISDDLHSYLYNNLYHENYNILSWNLQDALKTNANGKYI
jgi:hypothetical protein